MVGVVTPRRSKIAWQCLKIEGSNLALCGKVRLQRLCMQRSKGYCGRCYIGDGYAQIEEIDV